MKRLLFLTTLFSVLMCCEDNDAEDELVVDYLDMSGNDTSVQMSYRSSVEMFQNSTDTINIFQPDSCIGNLLQRRVLPKNGRLQITQKQIVYVPNRDFYGLDSIQYELCCNNKCNVFSRKFIVWKDDEQKCESLFANESDFYYHGYSIGEAATSTTIEVGLSPHGGCEQFIESIEINKHPNFGSVTVKWGHKIFFRGDLPENTTDTLVYTLKLRIGENGQDKVRTWVIQRFD